MAVVHKVLGEFASCVCYFGLFYRLLLIDVCSVIQPYLAFCFPLS